LRHNRFAVFKPKISSSILQVALNHAHCQLRKSQSINKISTQSNKFARFDENRMKFHLLTRREDGVDHYGVQFLPQVDVTPLKRSSENILEFSDQRGVEWKIEINRVRIYRDELLVARGYSLIACDVYNDDRISQISRSGCFTYKYRTSRGRHIASCKKLKGGWLIETIKFVIRNSYADIAPIIIGMLIFERELSSSS
jgi:hypothetical protein